MLELIKILNIKEILNIIEIERKYFEFLWN